MWQSRELLSILRKEKSEFEDALKKELFGHVRESELTDKTVAVRACRTRSENGYHVAVLFFLIRATSFEQCELEQCHCCFMGVERFPVCVVWVVHKELFEDKIAPLRSSVYKFANTVL